jgi:hypothetical protein
MKLMNHFALLGLALAAGCASHHDKISFSDEADIRAAMTSATTPPTLPKLDKGDQLQIEQLVFSYLLDRHFWDLADYSAVFLQADDAEVKAMMKKFPDHNPPIKQTFRVLVQPHRTPVDKDTGKPAMILSSDVNEPNPDGAVDAIGRWYAGDAVTGFRAFHLQKTDAGWQITEVK